MIEQKDEKKRNILWRMAISVSSILIIVIAAFFLTKLFTDNPMEGKWENEDSDLLINIKSDGTAVIQWPEKFEGSDVAVSMHYDMNKDAKILTLHRDETAMKDIAEETEGTLTTEQLDSVISSLEGSYDYNIEQRQLTLTEREYGEHKVFMKK